MALGAIGPAAAEDQRLNLDLDYLEARSGYVDLHDPTGPVSTGLRLDGDYNTESLWPDIWGTVVPYAGIGLGKINLGMQFENGEIKWEKEREHRKARVIAGVGYHVTPDLSLGLEFLAIAADKPLFALNLSGQQLEFDTRLTDQVINFTAQYRF